MASFRSSIKILCECSKLQPRNTLRARSLSNGAATHHRSLLPIDGDIKPKFLTNNWSGITEKSLLSRFYSDDSKDGPRCPPKPAKKAGICPPMKFPGCEPRAVPDCAVIKPREKCQKLEAPYPSYSECTREPTPPPRTTECPRTVRSPQPHCIPENLGLSYDGCNPPQPKPLVCPEKSKRAVVKRNNISCDVPNEKCDPSLKPYQNASKNTSSAIKCPSFTGSTFKVTEPIPQPKHCFTAMRFFSDDSKDGPRCPPKPAKKAGICPPMKFPGCEPRAVPDCAVIKPREKCQKLEAPYPSYSECTREPTPLPRTTECPRTVRSPQPHCIPENLGLSYDGCNPPQPKPLVCPEKSKRAVIKRKNISCDLPDEQCDPSLKPYKNASNTSSTPMKCQSASSIYAKVSEPRSGSKPFFFSTRSFSVKSKKPQEKCQKMPKKSTGQLNLVSPVSCLEKANKMSSNSKCETDLCAKFDTWKVCPKPKAVNSYRCPVKVKKTLRRLKKPKVVKCKKAYRECPCPPPLGPKCIEPEVIVEVPTPKCCLIKKVVRECPCPRLKSPCEVKKVEVNNQQRRCVCGPKVSAAAILKQSCSSRKSKRTVNPDCARSAAGLQGKVKISKPKPKKA